MSTFYNTNISAGISCFLHSTTDTLKKCLSDHVILDIISYVKFETLEDYLSILTFLDCQMIDDHTFVVFRNMFEKFRIKEIRYGYYGDKYQKNLNKHILIHATKHGLYHIIKKELKFLKKQMEADVKNAYKIFPFDDEGKNALHYAAIKGDIETFKMIESYFPKYINCVSRKNGHSTLEFAVGEGNLEIVEYLLKKGALDHTTFTNKFAKNSFTIYRHTPQHTAAENLYLDILFKLIEYDANMNLNIKGIGVFKTAERAGASSSELLALKKASLIYCSKGT